MKKFLMVLLVLLVIGIGTVGAQVWKVDAPKGYSLKLPKNQYSPGYQGVISAKWLFDGKQINAKETYELDITFKSDKALKAEELMVVLVDGSEKANWWTELSDWIKFEAIAANTDVSKKITFNTTKGALGTDPRCNQIVFDSQGSSVVNLTFSKFTFTRVK